MFKDFFGQMLKSKVRVIRNHFGFSKKESLGVLVALCLIMLSLSIPRVVKVWLSSTSSKLEMVQDSAMLSQWVDSLEQLAVQAERKFQKDTYARNNESYEVKTLTKFNPNDCSYHQLRSLGLSHYVSKNILSYREGGGSFKLKKHLLKIYGIDSAYVTSALWNYIDLPEDYHRSAVTNRIFDAPKKSAPVSGHISVARTSINKASRSQLQKVKGIGEYYSSCICEYRESLGGYYSYDQILEKCRLKPWVFRSLKNQFLLEDDELRFIDVNNSSVVQLSAHPYISNKIADQIVLYRIHHGGFKQESDIKSIKTMTDSLYQNLLPYLYVE